MLNGLFAIRSVALERRCLALLALRAAGGSRDGAFGAHTATSSLRSFAGERRWWRAFLVIAVTWALLPWSHAADAAPKTIIFFGDSLTAGYGLDDPVIEAYPARIEEKIVSAKLPYRVVNAGLSGETTAGGLRRVDWILRQPVDIFFLALGGNDGLRGIEPKVTRANLQGIIDRVRAKNPDAKLILAGMMIPPSMGQDYARDFAALYPDLAHQNHTAFVPFLLEGVGGSEELNQADRIHPTAAGHAILAETVWKILRPLL